MAVIAQIGYWKVIHPEWPDYILGETQKILEKQGLSENEVNQAIEQSRKSFTLRNYAIQSASSAFVLGVILSAIVLLFRNRFSPKATTPNTNS